MLIEIIQQPLTPELKKQVENGFSRHAVETIGYDEKFDPLAFVALDHGNLAGVIVVQLFWGALHIRYVFVDESYRGKNLGTQLMEQAIAYGHINNCPFAFVETMSFQALGFYQKTGFHLEFTRTGYAHGTSFHYLRRNLLKV